MTGAVVVDTNVFTARLRRDSGLTARYTKHLAAVLIAVAPQSVAEARDGALKSGWGTRRITELATMTAGVIVLSVDAEAIEQVARLRNACRKAGHALHQAIHNADLWIAAGAIRWGAPLVADDPCSSAVLASTCGRNSLADFRKRGLRFRRRGDDE